MTPEETAQLKDVLARFGREDLLQLVRSSGRKVAGHSCQCPLEGCSDQGGEARLNARVWRGNEAWVLSCHRCQKSADYVDVYRAAKGVDFKQALAELAGATPATKKPQLQLVRPVDDKKYLAPDKVRSAWEALAKEDEAGRAYLEGRRLAESIGAGLVRFATTDCAVPELKAKAKKGYRVAALLSDVAGQPVGVQFRTVLPAEGGDKLRGLKDGRVKGGYFGRPGDVLGSPVAVVVEGLADSLAVQLWVGEAAPVVGVPGAGNVAHLAEALEAGGVDVSGRLFVLLAQRDRGARGNQSLSAFMQLKARLEQRGADVVLESEPPGGVKDWALAWQQQQLGEWPPTQVKRYLAGADEGAADMVRAGAAAVHQPAEAVEPQGLGRDLSTLAWLLSAEATRRSVCGFGEWRLNQMTDAVEFGGRRLLEADYTRIRFNLEGYKGLDQKRLKFADGEVRAVARMVAEKSSYHPVREYLDGLRATGNNPFEEELPRAMHLDPERDGLQCEYVRRWMIAGAARAYQPGCQVDSMLVLFGGEGKFKSRFFEELGGPWFVRTSEELGSINFVEALRRGWVVELDELDAMAKADFPQVLANITRPTDYYSPKWVRENLAVPRHSVLGGSTNDQQFLPALTGDRRFWVVDISQPIDRTWVHDNRDRLWGWAVQFFKAGEQWHLEPELDALRAEDNKRYQAAHPWQSLVADYLAARPALDEVRTEDLLLEERCIGLARAQLNGAQGKLMGTILRNLGWAPVIIPPGRRRVWKRVEP